MNQGAKLFKAYRQPPGGFDEWFFPDGSLRDHWKNMVGDWESMGFDELYRTHQQAQLLLRETGVTYEVGDFQQMGMRPWQFDGLPSMVQEGEWAFLEAALKQRARLLNELFKDLYGPRRLIRLGLLPLELVHQHSHFIRACDKLYENWDTPLIQYAADIARGPDGRFFVVRDHTQETPGAGYAIENRKAMAKAMPDFFTRYRIRRLSEFFNLLQEGMVENAPETRGEPNLVLLARGPEQENHFENAYLASYLGITLVQGEDLIFRDGRIFMKSLDGLKPVDIILRRIEDRHLDPLEIESDAFYGVPGLIEAVRRKTVTLINPAGAGILENPALFPFLPAIAKELLGEDLLLPMPDTYWCGQPEGLRTVLDEMDQMMLSPVFRPVGMASTLGFALSPAERAEWAAKIQANPSSYVGQRVLNTSTSPILGAEGIEPRHLMTRFFLTAKDDEYHVMPGGLSRCATNQDVTVVPHQSDAVAKDTWVLGHRMLSFNPRPQLDTSERINEQMTTLSSRSAQQLFWVGRYAERAEQTVRFIRIVVQHFNQISDFDSQADQEALAIMLQALTRLTNTYPGFVEEEPEERLAHPKAELLDVVGNANRPGTLAYNLRSLMQATFSVRERWSNDTWRILNQLKQALDHLANTERIGLNRLLIDLDRAVVPLAAFSGQNIENMTQDLGWRLLMLGRRLERATLAVSLIPSMVGEADESIVGQIAKETLLTAMESLISYRRLHHTNFGSKDILRFLLINGQNPRSVLFQLESLSEHLKFLPPFKIGQGIKEEGKLILKAYTALNLSDMNELVREVDGRRAGLDALCDEIAQCLAEASDYINNAYFAHAIKRHQLTGTEEAL
ncbi:MAG: circularly permuted type 2 ATP-grasp protein [bacterium]|nr:circularly permuted type 2 ATP-grasp protein [bacterium]